MDYGSFDVSSGIRDPVDFHFRLVLGGRSEGVHTVFVD